MAQFTLYWLTGKRELVTGKTAQDAMTKAGYGHGALPALDFCRPGKDYSFYWNQEQKKWCEVPPEGIGNLPLDKE